MVLLIQRGSVWPALSMRTGANITLLSLALKEPTTTWAVLVRHVYSFFRSFHFSICNETFPSPVICLFPKGLDCLCIHWETAEMEQVGLSIQIDFFIGAISSYLAPRLAVNVNGFIFHLLYNIFQSHPRHFYLSCHVLYKNKIKMYIFIHLFIFSYIILDACLEILETSSVFIQVFFWQNRINL